FFVRVIERDQLLAGVEKEVTQIAFVVEFASLDQVLDHDGFHFVVDLELAALICFALLLTDLKNLSSDCLERAAYQTAPFEKFPQFEHRFSVFLAESSNKIVDVSA